MNEVLLEKLLEKYVMSDSNTEVAVKAAPVSAPGSTFIGEYVLIRGYDSGVHFGKLEEASKGHYVLSNSRRLWRFWCKKGIELTDLANFGLSDDEDKNIKICSTTPLILITDERVSEIIPVNKDLIDHFKNYPVATQD